MIKLINKDGMTTEVTEEVYAMWTDGKNGFTELREGKPVQAVIPDKIIEFQAKKQTMEFNNGSIISATELPKDEQPFGVMPPIPIVHSEAHKSDAAATMEIMKEFLKSKGIKFNPIIGYDKLKAKYDAANQES